MGENLAQKGDLSQALEIFNKLLSGINSYKDDKLKQSVYSSLGTTLFGLSRYEEAIANYQHALDLARKRYNTADVVDILNNIGFCLVSLKKYDDATRVFKEGNRPISGHGPLLSRKTNVRKLWAGAFERRAKQEYPGTSLLQHRNQIH